MAGIIGAEGNNKKGITGIVQNCNLLLAPLYESENASQYLWWDTSVYANLAYLVKAGAKVVNYSQGKTNFLTQSYSEYSKEFIEREGNLAAISIAKLLDAGYDFIVVQSAGNGIGNTGVAVDALQNGWFASITNSSITASSRFTPKNVLDRVIIVGAAEQSESGYICSSFSNFGSQVDIFAPGRNIYSTVPGEVFYDFQFFGGYAEASGTSMAAPIVTGVCALTWSSNTALSGADVKSIICNNTKDIVESNPNTSDTKAYRLVNAKLAIEAAINYSLDKQLPKSEGHLNQSSIHSGSTEFNGHYYHLYEDSLTWQEAKEACEKLGGHLVTITSKDEQDFISNLVRGATKRSYWIGLSDEAVNDQWTWVTGEPFSYSNWAKNEPNHGYGGYEHYVAIPAAGWLTR